MALWAITLFNYLINTYYPNYFPGDMFQNLIGISVVELFAYIIAGFFFDSVKTKKSTKLFIASYSICLVGGIGLLANDKDKAPYLDMIFNFTCKFGIASAYQGCYQSNILFPIVYASTTFGVCCMCGVISCLIAPFVYTL